MQKLFPKKKKDIQFAVFSEHLEEKTREELDQHLYDRTRVAIRSADANGEYSKVQTIKVNVEEEKETSNNDNDNDDDNDNKDNSDDNDNSANETSDSDNNNNNEEKEKDR
ncbi:hypothetical protein RFI_18929 [Reticulomyxa filosa]|uniref:Uncharacterized protein n=1 Tax=Reticulomyxa filosa TaxID=46433 RepID=X6MZ56_RETFI|nr:hypothetical protein RFI_18929 [Reticulomyxa filosa]|eukprot:ETO18345.1 hypothetical protein RFI_18929 [Reticulomyxa filosa]